MITGGGTGLGRSMGEYLLTLGANLVICGRRREVLEKAAAEMSQATGGKVLALRCDVREPEQVEAMFAAVVERFGTIHGLVNNAAGNFICPTERLSYNAFNSVVDIVLKGTYNCTLALGKRWIAEKTPGVGAEHQHDLCLDRLGLRRAVGGGQGGRADHGAFAGRRSGASTAFA